MVDLVEMFLDFTIISAIVCAASFVLWKRGGDRAGNHLARLRRYAVFGVVFAILGVVGTLWINMR